MALILRNLYLHPLRKEAACCLRTSHHIRTRNSGAPAQEQCAGRQDALGAACWHQYLLATVSTRTRGFMARARGVASIFCCAITPHSFTMFARRLELSWRVCAGWRRGGGYGGVISLLSSAHQSEETGKT